MTGSYPATLRRRTQPTDMTQTDMTQTDLTETTVRARDFTADQTKSADAVCVKCDQQIYVSNHDVLADQPDVGICWHTIADDEPLCDGPDPSTDIEQRYFHRPGVHELVVDDGKVANSCPRASHEGVFLDIERWCYLVAELGYWLSSKTAATTAAARRNAAPPTTS